MQRVARLISTSLLEKACGAKPPFRDVQQSVKEAADRAVLYHRCGSQRLKKGVPATT